MNLVKAFALKALSAVLFALLSACVHSQLGLRRVREAEGPANVS